MSVKPGQQKLVRLMCKDEKQNGNGGAEHLRAVGQWQNVHECVVGYQKGRAGKENISNND